MTKRSVLAIDDESLNGELLERAFRGRDDYTLQVCESPQDGLNRIATGTFDLILVDQSMPQMTGIEFVHRAVSLGTNATFLIVTAFPEMKEVIDAWNSGLVRFVVAKPWRATELMATLDRAVFRRR